MFELALLAISILGVILYRIIKRYQYSPLGIKTYQREDGIYWDKYEPVGLVKKLSLVNEPVTLTSKIHKEKFVVAGYEREFLYYVPNELRKNPKVIFVLHGSWADGRIIRTYTGYEFDQLADQEGFIVVYPNGYCGGWNEIRRLSPLKANKRNVNDLAFFETMLTYFRDQYQTDPNANLIFGFSNGGQMAFRLASEMPDQIAAIATVGASLPLQENSKIAFDTLPNTTAVMLVHGTEDKIVPIDGGEIRIMKIIKYGKAYSAEDTAELWKTAAGHDQAPRISNLGDVEIRTWMSPNLPSVKSLIVHGGGHTIPNKKYSFPNQADLTSLDISTVQTAWDFFSEAIEH